MRIAMQLARQPLINRALLVLLGLCLIAAPAAPQQSPDGLLFRRVWTSSAESPGVGQFPPVRGRFFATMVNQNPAIYDLAQDRVDVLTDNQRVEDAVIETGEPLLSPDGSRLVYRYTQRGRGGNEFQLRMINRDGSGQRVLLREAFGMPEAGTALTYSIQPMAWLPDGTTIIAQELASGTPEQASIVLISARDGSRRALRSFDTRSIGGLDVSPDGRHAAFDVTADDNGNRDVHIIDLENGSSRALVSGNGNDRLMGWDPDGSGIFFYSNRNLGGGIWKLRVRDGRPVGDPVLVRGDVWDMLPIGFSGDQFFYTVRRTEAQIRTTSVDIAAGQVITPPTMIRPPSESWSRDPAWSPDVRHLAYLDYSGITTNADWANSSARLAIRSVYTGETRYLEFPFLAGATLHWTERGMLVTGTHNGVRGIYSLDLTSGDVALLRESASGGTISPDGTTRYVRRNNGEILARDIATGRETLVGRLEDVGLPRRMGISPDGSMLAAPVGGLAAADARLFVLPTAGGDPREIYQGEALRAMNFLAFTPDNRYVVGASFWEPAGVWRIPVDGSSEPLKILEGEAPRSFRLSSDGRRIAYWEWQNPEGSTELWVIEGLVGAGSGR